MNLGTNAAKTVDVSIIPETSVFTAPRVKGKVSSTPVQRAVVVVRSAGQHLTLYSRIQMETPKNTNGNNSENSSSKENSSKKFSESKEAEKDPACGAEESKRKTKDACEGQTLLEEFCGFDETETIQTRSSKEASRTTTPVPTRKISSKPETGEGKSDSPPDLVLFLKEGRGRSQTYSEPPRLDPESIATRRRTRVPDDPVALISRTKSMSADKPKKDQKLLIKKERKTKFMDTPESLKRLAREQSKQVQATNKESSDSGSEEKMAKNVESDVKVKSIGTSTRLGEEQPALISKKNSRGKRNSADETEPNALGNNGVILSEKDSSDESMNYSNLGSILNKMNRNVADKRIPVVIMSKSEKEAKVDCAKPKSKKRSPDRNLSSAVLKIASATVPVVPATESIEEVDQTLSPSEKESKTHKQDESCSSPSSRSTGSYPDAQVDLIPSKVNICLANDEVTKTSDVKSKTEDTTHDSSSNSSETVQAKQNIMILSHKEQANADSESSKVSEVKDSANNELCQRDSLKLVQESASSLAASSTSFRSGTVPVPIRAGLVVTPVRSSPILPKPITLPIRASLITSHGKPSPVSTPISLSPLGSQVKPSTSLGKQISTESHVKATPSTLPIRSSSSMSQVKSTFVTSTPAASQAKLSPSTSAIKSNPSVSHIKPTSGTSQIKPNLIMSHVKHSPSTSPTKSSLPLSQVKASSSSSSPTESSLLMSKVKHNPVSSPIRPTALLSHIKPIPGVTLSKASPPVKASPVPPSSKSTLVTTIKSSSELVTSSIKPGSVTSSSLSQNDSSSLFSTPKILSYGSGKGSVKMANLTSSKIGVRESSCPKALSVTPNPKRETTSKQESASTSTKVTPGTKRNKTQSSEVSAQETLNELSQKDPMLDYGDIDTEEVVLGDNDDSIGQMDKVGDIPAEADLLAHEELDSSSEEETDRMPGQSLVPPKESLSPEGRVALDHSYSSGGSGNSRKKSPTTYEKSLTPRPVYSSASPAKRSLDILLHNDKINILRQMSQIFNDEKPPSKIFSDERDSQPDTDNSVLSCSDEEDPNTAIKKTEKNIPTMSICKTKENITAEPNTESVKLKKVAKATTYSQEKDTSNAVSSIPLAVEEGFISDAFATSPEASISSETMSFSQGQNSTLLETPPHVESRGNDVQNIINVTKESPSFLGFPDSDPKVHHVPIYSLSLNEKISVQSKVGPAGEVIDIVDGFSFVSFSSEKELMSYNGTYSGKTARTHRQWLKKKRRKRKRLIRLKGGMRRAYHKVLHEGPTPSVARSATSKERDAIADCGAFASVDLDTFLVQNSHLNISYQIPKCKVTEDGVSKIDEEEVMEPTLLTHTQTQPLSPHSPLASHSPPDSPRSPHLEVTHGKTQTVNPINPNTKAVEQAESESVPQYEEVNAIDILYPKEKYKYYYNKELCKETKADGSNVFVQRAGKLVPLTTIFKHQKSPLSEQPSTNITQSVEIVYVYDGGKLLTLGGSLTKINPSNSDCVRARVVLPIGVPPIPKGETVAARAKKVQAVEINEEMAKFALSALQNSYLKTEQTGGIKDDREELSPVAGTSSGKGNEENADVDSPPTVPVDKTETTVTPKDVSSTLTIKPTKRNILDIIAAKLAMSDDESDEKEEVEKKDAIDNVKEIEQTTNPTVDNSQTTTHEVTEVKEEEIILLKEEGKDANVDQEAFRTSWRSKIPLLKQENFKDKQLKEESEVKLETSGQEENVKSKPDEDVTQATKDTQKSSDWEEKKKDENEHDIVSEINDVIDVENSEKRKSEINVDVGEENVGENVVLDEKEHQEDGLSLTGINHAGEIESERKMEHDFDEKDKVTHLVCKGKENENTVSADYKNKNESNAETKEESKEDNGMKPKEDHDTNNLPLEKKDLQNTSEVGNEEESDIKEENISSAESQAVNLKEKETGKIKEADVKDKRNFVLIEREPMAESEKSVILVEDEDKVNPPSEAETLDNICSSGSTSQANSIINEATSDSSGEIPRRALIPSYQELEDKTCLEEKARDSLENSGQEAYRMGIKLKVFKKNVYRFPSLSREMKRLNMNFVSYEPPPNEVASEEKEEQIQEVKEDCNNEHCKLGCVCDSLLCQRKSVEHCGRVECMFECTCRDESWKLPSGSGRTMNAVSIFNLDREQKEGLALREKDFKRTVIQTGSEVILVGAERKKREIRLPGRYRETTVWAASEFPENGNTSSESGELLQSGYPGIPLSEAFKYIKNFNLNIPWFDIKGISVWCMDHSCYDCKCLTDPTYGDLIPVEPSKNICDSRERHESSPGKCGEGVTPTASPVLDFQEALKQKTSDDPSTINDLQLKIPFVTDANCCIMNVIVNNSETRRKYTWKLKEWYHHTEYFSARTAGYSKNKVTEETKNMTLSGLAARDSTPEQIVETVVKSLRHQNADDQLKLPSLPCGNSFEPFMGDSLINLQNAIGFNPDSMNKDTRTETPCPLVDLTSVSEDITTLFQSKAKLGLSSQEFVNRPPKDFKGAMKKRKASSLVKPLLKKARFSSVDEGLPKSKKNADFIGSYIANPSENIPYSGEKVPKRTLSLLEMMIDEEKRGELELDLSNNIPGNALLVAEARFRKLINMNIIGVIGINKAGRCIVGTVDSEEALQVMHLIQNMIRNNTLDVGPNMREIFFPPPYSGIRPRFVMIRCDSHRKWEIVGVVQKKGPSKEPSKISDSKAKTSITKPEVPQVIDLEEEEKQKQIADFPCDIKEEDNFGITEPLSPNEKDSGDWEGSLPMIASVHSASDSNMAELIGFPETPQEEPEELHLAEESLVKTLKTPTQKALPDLVPISSSFPSLSVTEGQDDSLSETQAGSSENSSPQKLYFVPTSVNVPASTQTTTVDTDTTIKAVTLNLGSSKVFGDTVEKLSLPSKALAGNKKISYILPQLSRSESNETMSSTQKASKNITEEHDTGTGQVVGASVSSSSKMLYIPVTSSCVSKVLFVPSVSSGSSKRMMLLPTRSGTNSLDTSSTSSTGTSSTISTATITTSKMKMVLIPSSQDANKMILIPATPDDSGGASGSATGTSSMKNGLPEGEKKKMVVLTPSVINSLVSGAPSLDTASTPSYQPSVSGTLIVPLHDTGDLPTKHNLNESEKNLQTQQECSTLQDNLCDDIGSNNNSLPVTGMVTSSESMAVREETPVFLVSPVPKASSSGVAETNVVSSLTTISSTIPEETLCTNECDSEATSHNKKEVSKDALNTLLSKTHEEMVTETKAVAEELSVESLKDMGDGDTEAKKAMTKFVICSQNSDPVKKVNTQDEQKKQMLIKKGGFHWSAVDLSINFKSVKLEWLLGTIRKNILMNIYRMSKKTHSPVTLSVKNGTSPSMLYGFAKHCSTSTLPILILGSVVSAVLSSSSVPDSMLFQINSIKYFIRESTGELSSYTYSSESHLVKLASKKRGNGGEMVGVGEQVEIYKMRDPVYQSDIEKLDTETGKAKGSLSSMGIICRCKETGGLTCKRRCAPWSSSKAGVEDSSSQKSKYSITEIPSERETKYASLRLQDTPMAQMHPKEEHRFPSSSKFPMLKELQSENLRQILTKPRTMPSKTKVVVKTVSKLESYAQLQNEELNLPNIEKEKSVVPKVECGSEEDIDVLGDSDTSPSILNNLWLQWEAETCEVQKLATSGDSVKKRGMNVLGRPPMKKMRTAVSQSGVEQPCPRSRKQSLSGKMKKVGLPDNTASTSDDLGRDAVDASSRWPTHFGYLRPDVSVADEENSNSYLLIRDKTSPVSGKQSLLYAAINRARQVEERNTELHNKLERMRRKVMRHLFTHLQSIIVKIPRNPLSGHTGNPAKKTVLNAGQRVCEILREEETRLTIEEEKLRNERSDLIRHLAAIIGDSNEEIKFKWRNWVRENMQNPTAKQIFETNWQPFCLEKDILQNALEGNFDIDYDGGSPLPEGSPVFASTSLRSRGDNRVVTKKIKRVPGRRIFRKRGKKLGRPPKVQPTPGSPGGLVDNATIPTSILLMAGTSSRGRKIVRKEDMNFVT